MDCNETKCGLTYNFSVHVSMDTIVENWILCYSLLFLFINLNKNFIHIGPEKDLFVLIYIFNRIDYLSLRGSLISCGSSLIKQRLLVRIFLSLSLGRHIKKKKNRIVDLDMYFLEWQKFPSNIFLYFSTHLK